VPRLRSRRSTIIQFSQLIDVTSERPIGTLNAGGAFARLDLTAEACKSLIAQAIEETRALQRALRP